MFTKWKVGGYITSRMLRCVLSLQAGILQKFSRIWRANYCILLKLVCSNVLSKCQPPFVSGKIANVRFWMLVERCSPLAVTRRSWCISLLPRPHNAPYRVSYVSNDMSESLLHSASPDSIRARAAFCPLVNAGCRLSAAGRRPLDLGREPPLIPIAM